MSKSRIDNRDSHGRGYWWVNHKQTYRQEVDGGYLWSPVTRSDGARNEFYENMKLVRPGDVVFSFASGLIQSIGLCRAAAVLAPKPPEFGAVQQSWSDEGWRVSVGFRQLSEPMRPKSHMDLLA